MSAASPPTHEVPLPDGLLIIGHGTRDPRGRAEFQQVVDQVAQARPDVVVEPAFLELAEPTIEQGVAAAVKRGASHIVAMPLLLFSAGHAKRDIPNELARCAALHPGLVARQASVLECHERLLELSAQRFRDAIEPNHCWTSQQWHTEAGAADTLILFVGRGSHDPQANAEMARFARLRFEMAPVGWHEVCFTAMARPSLDEGFERAARLGFGRVVVQPHLLFQGELLARVAARVEQARRDHPHIEWLLSDHLGPDPKVTQAVLEITGLLANEAFSTPTL